MGEHGIEAVDLHGNLSQRVRERNLRRFSTGRAQAVVATDVAARGIHVDQVGLVVHYDLPGDAKAYLHRSGRTARAGESGAVVTLATPRQLAELARMQDGSGIRPRHHDIRSAPRPMTAEALAESGEERTPRRPGRKPAADRSRRSGGKPVADRPRRNGERSTGPVRRTSDGRKKKPRWSESRRPTGTGQRGGPS